MAAPSAALGSRQATHIASNGKISLNRRISGHKESSAEGGEQGAPQVFNLNALSVLQIARLNWALRREHSFFVGLTGDKPGECWANEFFITTLRNALHELVEVDIDRAKEIVRFMKEDYSTAHDGFSYGQQMAAECLPAFVPHDYEFARDTWMELNYGSGDSGAEAATEAWGKLDAQLSHEQRLDLDARCQARERQS